MCACWTWAAATANCSTFWFATGRCAGRGIELSEPGVLACVRRGLSVRQGNLQEGLADYPDNSFDWVILSQTLPFLNDPAMILREMLRVGQAGGGQLFRTGATGAAVWICC
jgi:hypothetical protein